MGLFLSDLHLVSGELHGVAVLCLSQSSLQRRFLQEKTYRHTLSSQLFKTVFSLSDGIFISFFLHSGCTEQQSVSGGGF